MNQLVPIQQNNVDAYRASTDAAALCKDIVVASAMEIQGRKYVKVEGWQAIAIAHGCTASAKDVERVEGGFRATGEVRRMDDGTVIAEAEGFVGEDEPTWFGGEVKNKWGTKTLPKRPDYAIRCMAQTRAISRACRSAFAHVVVMMNAGLSTTPAEEVPHGGFDDAPHDPQTGEIIDHEAQQPSEPAARQKLDGPHTSKTALRKAIIDVIAKVRAAETQEAISAIVKEHKPSIDQAKRDWPALIDGDPNIEEDIGLRGALAARKEQLAVGDEVKSLIASLKETETKVQLVNWLGAHSDEIDELDGAASRTFQLAYDIHESAINAMDGVNA